MFGSKIYVKGESVFKTAFKIDEIPNVITTYCSFVCLLAQLLGSYVRPLKCTSCNFVHHNNQDILNLYWEKCLSFSWIVLDLVVPVYMCISQRLVLGQNFSHF